MPGVMVAIVILAFVATVTVFLARRAWARVVASRAAGRGHPRWSSIGQPRQAGSNARDQQPVINCSREPAARGAAAEERWLGAAACTWLSGGRNRRGKPEPAARGAGGRRLAAAACTWLCAVNSVGGCGLQTLSDGPTSSCSAGCTHTFRFDVPGGVYIARARLTAEAYGDLDYGPNENARVVVDGSQFQGDCFGAENAWLPCASDDDVTHLLATQNGASTITISVVSSTGASTFQARASITLEFSVTPWLGPVSGGTSITLGSGCTSGIAQNVSRAGWSCEFERTGGGGATQPFLTGATYDGVAQTVNCDTPAVDASHQGWYNVTIIAADGVALSDSVVFYAYSSATSVATESVTGSLEANTAVRLTAVELDGFISVSPVAALGRSRGFAGGCTFGATPTDLVYDAVGDIYVCMSPAGSGSVPISSALLNGQQHTYLPDSMLTRDSTHSADIGAVSYFTPVAVPRGGGTLVKIRTSNIVGTDYQCAFKPFSIVDADFSAVEDSFSCTFPASEYATDLPPVMQLEITTDRVHFSDDAVELKVFSVSSLVCAHGPSVGGHVTSLLGQGFIDATTGLLLPNLNRKFRFGHDQTPYLPAGGDTALISIVTPPGTSGDRVPVEVTFIGNDPQCQNDAIPGCYTTDQVLYSYIGIQSLYPISGPSTGDTNVTVTGVNFGECEQVVCRFGTTVVAAYVLSSTTVWCVSPAATVGSSAVEVSMNGIDFTTDGVQFGHFEVPTIGAILPDRGSQYSCKTVVAFGLNLNDGTDYRCRFGDAVVSANYDASDSSVVCDCSASAEPDRVYLEVSLNGQQYTTSQIEFEFMASNVVDMSAFSGTATGLETVDIHFSFPGPDWLSYLCVWNGYTFAAMYISNLDYVDQQGYPIGVARCVTPEADKIPYTQLRTAFEEPVTLAGRTAEIDPSNSTCSGLMQPSQLTNTVGSAVVAYGDAVPLMYAAGGLRFGDGRWEASFRTTIMPLNLSLYGAAEVPFNKSNSSSYRAPTETCYVPTVGIVSGFVDTDGTGILPNSGNGMYLIHGTKGFVTVEMETIDLVGSQYSDNLTVSCWMRMGAQTSNRAKIWAEQNNGSDAVLFEFVEVEEIIPEPEPADDITLDARVEIVLEGRATVSSLIFVLTESIPLMFGNALVDGLDIALDSFYQRVDTTSTLPDASIELRDWVSATGSAARQQFRYGVALLMGVDVNNVNVTSTNDDPDDADVAVIGYSVEAEHDLYPVYASSNFSDLLATSINSAGTRLVGLTESDILNGDLVFESAFSYNISFRVNQTYNVSNITDAVETILMNSSATMEALDALNTMHNTTVLADVASVNTTVVALEYDDFFGFPEPEPEIPEDADVALYRAWTEYSLSVDFSSSTALTVKFGALFVDGNETYAFDDCKEYRPAVLPFTADVKIKALYGKTVNDASYSFHAPLITTVAPLSGVITGDTNLTIGMNYPGVAASTIQCGFNGVLLDAEYLTIGDQAGMVSCVTPHLGYCHPGARRYSATECLIQQSLFTIATPFEITLTVVVDGVASSNEATFVYTAVSSIDYIYPSSGPSFASIVIVGNRLEQGTDYVVRFDDILVPALYQEGSCEAGSCRVLTTVPGGSVGTAMSVELALNGQQFSTSGSTFTFTDVDECDPSPCLHGAACLESSVQQSINLGEFECICTNGWEGDTCSIDADECVSVPCLNGATCVDSNDLSSVAINGYQCSCASGWEGTHCQEDIDECFSSPCLNGAGCSESSVLDSVPAGHFSCACVAGFANGMCNYAYISEYQELCTVLTDTPCDIDVWECASSPCQNGAACADSYNASEVNVTSGAPFPHEYFLTGNVSGIPIDQYSCACVAGFANGLCDYNFISVYTANCTIELGGFCDIDIDECVSNPCVNNATCEDSSTTQHVRQRTAARSLGLQTGNVTDAMMVSSSVKPGATGCATANGRLNHGVSGWPSFSAAWCPEYARSSEYLEIQFKYKSVIVAIETQGRYNTGQWVKQYSLAYSVDGITWENLGELLPGNTDETSIVRNELTEPIVALHFRIYPEEWHAWPSLRMELYGFRYGPISYHAFSCTCTSGYTGGVCGYDYLPIQEVQCTVAEGGICDMDVSECDSNPCQNGATCVDSVTDPTIVPGMYACHCAPGYTDGICTYAFIPEVADTCNVQLGGSCGVDVDECLSNPCANGGTCTDSTSLLRPVPVPEPPLRYVHGESTLFTLGSLPKGGMENSTAQLLMHHAGTRLAAVESDVLSMNISTQLRLIVADHRREFDQDTPDGIASRAQLLAGLAAATYAAVPTVSLVSVQYSSSYSTLPATHVIGDQSYDVTYDWIAAGAATPLAVGIQTGSIPVTIPDSAFSATSRFRLSENDVVNNYAEFARLHGPKQWSSNAVIPEPSPVGITVGSSQLIPDASITASSQYDIKENQARWLSIDTTINNADELQDWLNTTTGAGLSNQAVCISRNGVLDCNFGCFECHDSSDVQHFPMYISLDDDHGQVSDSTTTVASFMRWRHPNIPWTGWRKVPLNNGEAPAQIPGDMRGRAVFVVGDLDNGAMLRGENGQSVTGYQAIQYSEDLGTVVYPASAARLAGDSHWLPVGLAEDPEPWIQVDIGRTARISGVATQGAGPYQERVTGFVASWSHDGTTFTAIDAVFPGNTLRDTSVDHWFPEIVIARYIRLNITSFESYAALRFEVYEDIPWSGDEYIQVDLQYQAVLTGIATQGSAGDTDHWITKYSISYKTALNDAWEYYSEFGDVKIFDANTDASSVVLNAFQGRVEARYIRLHIYSFNLRASLRMEIYREPLDYFIVDAAIESPTDTSAIVDDPAYKSVVTTHSNGAGAFQLDPADTALFTPYLTASIHYNYTGLVNIRTSVNVTRLEEDLVAVLGDNDEVLAVIQTAPEHDYRVYYTNVTSAHAATREVELEPEPEPEPYYVPEDSYSCACPRGWADGMCMYDFIDQYDTACNRLQGGHCAIDVDECASTPCSNGGSCTDLSSAIGGYADVADCELLQPQDTFSCTATVHVVVTLHGHEITWQLDDGQVYGPYPQAAQADPTVMHYYTTVNLLSSTSNGTQHAVHVFDAGGDGWHGGYLEILDKFDVAIVGPVSPAASQQTENFDYFCHCGIDEYVCRCPAGYADGICEYVFIPAYDDNCTLTTGGSCNIDVDECASDPCVNGAVCVDSTTQASVSVHAYKCLCAAGYAGGMCDYTFITEYTSQCTQSTGGFCDIDVDECASNPCINGGTCTDSISTAVIAVNSYSCSCAAGFTNGLCAYNFVEAYRANCTVGLGGHCDIDVDECVSAPCVNGAVCTDSTSANPAVGPHAYRCTCVAGYTNGWCDYNYIADYTAECTLQEGGYCDVDVDECVSNACASESTCIESSQLRFSSLIISEYMEGSASNDAIEVYNPTCHPVDLTGYTLMKIADGGDWAEAAAAASAVGLHGILEAGGVYVLCNMCFDAASLDNDGVPYINRCNYTADTVYKVNFEGDDAIGLSYAGVGVVDAVGMEGPDPGTSWAVGSASQFTTAQHTLLRRPGVVSGSINWGVGAATEWDGIVQPPRSADNLFDTLGAHSAELNCDRYDFDQYVCLCPDGWMGENCATDVDECTSDPCQNGATCSDSSGNVAVPVDRYRCSCAPGYANGQCAYAFISNYTDLCTVPTGGFCDIDVDECASNPCINGSPCTDSTTTDSTSATNAYFCSCRPGYANGLCNYTVVEQYADQCAVATGGYCDVDVNECASNPCANGASCADSRDGTIENMTVPANAFSCACIQGFANGMCDYAYTPMYERNCTVFVGGRCDEDVDECLSNPCLNQAACVDSISDPTVGAGYYSCICRPGYAGQQCQTDVDECASTPCVNNGTCVDRVDSYVCVCESGWDGDECEFEINPCSRTQDDCLGNATCISTGPGAHLCLCDRGYSYLTLSRYRYVTPTTNSSDDVVCLDNDECLSTPCLNGAGCTHLVDAYTCQCQAGYEDSQCETDTNECASNPCTHGAVCNDVVANYTCSCVPGYSDNNCATDMDECHSSPCFNGATCVESGMSLRIAVDFFTCICGTGFAGELCDEDVDECASQPCQNGGVCLESHNDTSVLTDLTGVPFVAPGAYHCSCTPGYGNGWCAFSFYQAFVGVCRVEEGGHCDIDLDECSSSPCSNGAACAESFRDDAVPPNAYACVCLPGFANGRCEYSFIPEYSSVCNIATTGRCDIDVDECASMPCLNRVQCLDSSQDTVVPVHSYSCVCTAGFANGWCDYSYLQEYTSECTERLGGHCDIDVDECASNPCTHGASCTDSSIDSTISIDEYVCTCLPGFANGMCHYLFVLEYAVECSRVAGGACDIDVDECISQPCRNGATCTDSTLDAGISPHAYRCECAPGFANGKCDYDFVDQYEQVCRVMESDPTASQLANVGNCDMDVDECVSAPCYNAAVCKESGSSDQVSVHAYSCMCAPGYADGACDYAYIPEYQPECVVMESTSSLVGVGNGNCRIDVDECSSSPCVNGAQCSDRGAIDSFTCSCRDGYDGQLCSIDIAECASAPCKHGATCSETAERSDEYACACVAGWQGNNCEFDVDECASSPCRYPAPCTDGIDFFRCGAPLQVQLVLETTLDEWDESFELTFRDEVATRLGVDISRVKVVGLAEGSLVVDVQILPPASADEPSLSDAADLFQTEFIDSGGVAIGGIPVAVGETVVDESALAALGCPPGYDGMDCSININECDSRPCRHLGTCSDEIAAYSCSCQVGWSGDNCDEKLNMDAEFTRILGPEFLGIVPGSVIVIYIAMYVKMNRMQIDIPLQNFAYSFHAMGSTLTIAGATIATITFASFVRPATTGFYSHIRVMAPQGEGSMAALALPCPARAGSTAAHGGCECAAGFERESAPGASLCITEPRFCVNETFYYCAAVMGDGTTLDTLAVDQYDSCEGTCSDGEQSGQAIKILVGLYMIVFCFEWGAAVGCLCTHLHRVPACLPMWEWRFPPSYRVYVAFRWVSVLLHAAAAIFLAVLSSSFAELINADCFSPDTVFALGSIEQHLGMAFGTCIINLLVGIVNLGVIHCGKLSLQRSKLSRVAASTRYLEPPGPAEQDERAMIEAGMGGTAKPRGSFRRDLTDSGSYKEKSAIDSEDDTDAQMLAVADRGGGVGVRGGSSARGSASGRSGGGGVGGTAVTSFSEFSDRGGRRERGGRRGAPSGLPGTVDDSSGSGRGESRPLSLADSVRARTSLGRAQGVLNAARESELENAEKKQRKPRSPPDDPYN